MLLCLAPLRVRAPPPISTDATRRWAVCRGVRPPPRAPGRLSPVLRAAGAGAAGGVPVPERQLRPRQPGGAAGGAGQRGDQTRWAAPWALGHAWGGIGNVSLSLGSTRWLGSASAPSLLPPSTSPEAGISGLIPTKTATAKQYKATKSNTYHVV